MSRSSRIPLGKSKSVEIKKKKNPREAGSSRQIIIPSSLDFLPKVDEYIERKLRRLGVDKDKLADIAVAVSEAVTNAVMHGNKNDLNKNVTINLKADSSCVEITVEDEGHGFVPECINSPIETKNLLKETGRGVFILKSLMDKVEFTVQPKRGTTVKMTKFLS
jgi:serine/threonine-protein kinase RsbW